MTCQDWLDRMLAGLSDGEGADELTRHETGCALCQRRGSSMRAALDGIAALPADTPKDFARGAWQRVASARAPWEESAPTLAERVAAWFALPRLMLAGIALGMVLVTAGLLSVRGRSDRGDDVAVRVTQSSAGVEVLNTRRGTGVAVPDAGHATLELGAATTVVFAGPANARARSAGLLEVDEGAIAVDVRHDLLGAEGLRVVTPHLSLKVTGTKFNVRVLREETVVELITGQVELESGGQMRLMIAGERVRSAGKGLEVVTRAKGPAWPLPPAEARTGDAKPVERPGAPVREPEPKPATRPGQRIEGQALPPVNANANVHDPFRGRER